MPTFASDTRSLCCFLSLLLQLKCTEGNHEVELSIRYLEVWVGARAQRDDEYLASSIITYNYNLSSLYYFKYIPKNLSSFGGGPTKLFTRVIAILRSPSCPHWTGTTQIASSNGSHSPCLTLFCPTSHACSPSLSFCFPTVNLILTKTSFSFKQQPKHLLILLF